MYGKCFQKSKPITILLCTCFIYKYLLCNLTRQTVCQETQFQMPYIITQLNKTNLQKKTIWIDVLTTLIFLFITYVQIFRPNQLHFSNVKAELKVTANFSILFVKNTV